MANSVAVKTSPDEAASRQRRRYVLIYHRNEMGLAKRIEFEAGSAELALQFALADPMSRTIDVWEDGELAFRLSPHGDCPDPRRCDPAKGAHLRKAPGPRTVRTLSRQSFA